MDRDTQKLVQEAPALPEKTGPPSDFPLAYPTGVQVISMPPTTVPQNDVRFSWGTLVTAIVSFFCCSLCGFPATVLAVLAHADHKVKHYTHSKQKNRWSLCCGITGIVIGTLIFILIVAAWMYSAYNYYHHREEEERMEDDMVYYEDK